MDPLGAVKLKRALGITYDEAQKVIKISDDEATVGIHKITNATDAMEAFFLSSFKSKAHHLLFRKWVSLCTKADEIKRAHGCIPFEEYREAVDLENLFLAEHKWDTLSLAAVRVASNIEEVREAFTNARPNSEAQQVALDKMSRLI